MRRKLVTPLGESIGLVVALFVFLFLRPSVGNAARVGDRAPDFTATDSNGTVHKLSQYQGKFVVLEWTNRGCPYTQKHYNSGNMQRLQREWTSRGVIWLTVISSASGKQGYVTAPDENVYVKQVNVRPRLSCLIPRACSVTSMTRRPRRICSSSTRRESWFTTVPLTTGRQPTWPM